MLYARSPAPAFGLLTYRTDNLGDEIQSIAARRFLPTVDYNVERDSISDFRSRNGERVALVMNGWFIYNPEKWPPSPDLVPLPVAMHVTDEARRAFLSRASMDWLMAHGPIGARDAATLEFLQGAGIDAYFSGCVTLTLDRPPVPRDDDLIVLNDLTGEAATRIWFGTSKKVIITTHARFANPDPAARFARAQELLEIYARASCVVTSRLHCALPCLAIGTPVLLLDVAPDQYRFSGLGDFVNRAGVADFEAGKCDWDWNAPAPNPERHLEYRRRLTHTLRDFVRRQSGIGQPDPVSIARLRAFEEAAARVEGEIAERTGRLADLRGEIARLAGISPPAARRAASGDPVIAASYRAA
jgi:hypothetical protein